MGIKLRKTFLIYIYVCVFIHVVGMANSSGNSRILYYKVGSDFVKIDQLCDQEMECIDPKVENENLSKDSNRFTISQINQILSGNSQVRNESDHKIIATGPGVPGGSYPYLRSAVPTTGRAIKRILDFLNKVTDFEFNLLQSKWSEKISDKNELINQLNRIEFEFNIDKQIYIDSSLGKFPLLANFEGTAENNGKIIIQPEFLRTYNSSSSIENENEIIRIIIHEISHLFGIGVDDDNRALEFSEAMLEIILSTERIGKYDIIESTNGSSGKEHSCTKTKQRFKTFLISEALSYPFHSQNESSIGVENLCLEETNIFTNQSRGEKPWDQSTFILQNSKTNISHLGRDEWEKLYKRACEKLTRELNNESTYKLEKRNSYQGRMQVTILICTNKK